MKESLNKGRILKKHVKYQQLHIRVKKKFPKPDLCMICKKVPPIDLANITGIYEDELKNWAYMCKKCHIEYDNIIPRLMINRKKPDVIKRYYNRFKKYDQGEPEDISFILDEYKER